ncbi:hypothetical protein AcW1_000206 [Taiwanofungus camphoratus]|nr:hypothetical protein AcW2_001300 [Antrodia cinnamomea]KAI0962997.1 hypothetical protein AcW1_000206 [Antrodia cinnamomea]
MVDALVTVSARRESCERFHRLRPGISYTQQQHLQASVTEGAYIRVDIRHVCVAVQPICCHQSFEGSEDNWYAIISARASAVFANGCCGRAAHLAARNCTWFETWWFEESSGAARKRKGDDCALDVYRVSEVCTGNVKERNQNAARDDSLGK